MLKVEYADGLYSLLGAVSSDDYVIPTPLEPQCPCGENTSNSNVLATLLKGVDGITPDMSDYYDKRVVEDKLSQKQNVIADLATIRSNASKGATALQSVPWEYVTESELSAKGYATTSQVNAKQDKISDLDTIRSGAAKGATALQSETYKGTVTGVKVNGSTKNPINGIVDIGTVITSHQDISGKQDKIADLDAIRSGAAKGATALQEHQPLKTINGESIVGSGNITIEGGGGGVTEEYVDNAIAEVNVKGEDGYVYSNGEKVDMRIRRSLIPVGTPIPASANLNTIAYLKVGNYYCSQTANAKTITNCPVEVAFSMEVFNPLSETLDDETTSTYTYRIRKITAYNTGVQYMQYCNTSGTAGTWTYGSWYVVPRTSFSLASDKNGGSAVKGASNRGIYIDSTGTFQQMSYTVGKSVPSNAVFTDTNTKVTSVDNHYAPAEDESVVLNAPEGEVVVGLKRDAAGHVVGVMSTPMSSGGGGGGGTITEAEIAAMGFTKNQGTITEVKMNGVSKGTSGVVDLGDVPTKDVVDGLLDWQRGADEDIANLYSDKQDVIADLATIRKGASFGVTAVQPRDISEFITVEDVATVATSGSYNDLQDKPTIPSAVTESTVSGWGFTKNTGTYSKPSGGIPKTDLDSDVQSALDNAVQRDQLGDMEVIQTQGFNGTSSDILYALPNEANGDEDDILLSRDSVKTINGQSIFGSGDMTVTGNKEVVTAYLKTFSALSPNKVTILSDEVSNTLIISSLDTTESQVDEYTLHFKTVSTISAIAIVNLPTYVKKAENATFFLEANSLYELSIVKTKIGGTDYFKAVLTKFS